jgi:hypothetical protein
MPSDTAKMLFHNANTDVVHCPLRRNPSVAIEGHRLSDFFDALRMVTNDCKRLRYQEGYAELHTLTDMIQRFLLDYEQALQQHGISLPYDVPIQQRWLAYEDNG